MLGLAYLTGAVGVSPTLMRVVVDQVGLRCHDTKPTTRSACRALDGPDCWRNDGRTYVRAAYACLLSLVWILALWPILLYRWAPLSRGEINAVNHALAERNAQLEKELGIAR